MRNCELGGYLGDACRKSDGCVMLENIKGYGNNPPTPAEVRTAAEGCADLQRLINYAKQHHSEKGGEE